MRLTGGHLAAALTVLSSGMGCAPGDRPPGPADDPDLVVAGVEWPGPRIAVEASTRERFGLPPPARPTPEGASWRPESAPMMLRAEAVAARDRMHCYVPGADRYPRRHGSHAARFGEFGTEQRPPE